MKLKQISVSIDGEAHPFVTLVQVFSFLHFISTKNHSQLLIYSSQPSFLDDHWENYDCIERVHAAYPHNSSSIASIEGDGRLVLSLSNDKFFFSECLQDAREGLCPAQPADNLWAPSDVPKIEEICQRYIGRIWRSTDFKADLKNFSHYKSGSNDIFCYSPSVVDTEPFFFLDFELLDIVKEWMARKRISALHTL
jgi:hypothetical protein